MEGLISKSEKKSKSLKAQQKRYLYEQIEWGQKLILILGYRGAGKTTLLLQYLSASRQKGIYLSLDDFYFESNRLIQTISTLYELGYRSFLMDEVHRYGWWSKDLKQLYDDYEDIQLVATGSSILDVSRGHADLSRRAAVYHLYGLSFREYLNFRHHLSLKKLELMEVLNEHHLLAPNYLDRISIQKDFQEYLKFGYYPYFLESKNTYHQKLYETIKMVIDTDIAPFEELQHSTIRILKKLLFVLSESVPFSPNINKLAATLEAPRNTILRLLDILDKAQILHLLRTATKGASYLQKPDKIYLQNTNLIYTLTPNMHNVGNIRETFFINQLQVLHTVTTPKFGDFMVDESYVFEVGGSTKTAQQIKGVPNAYLALDIASGNTNRIPLWLFGMLY